MRAGIFAVFLQNGKGPRLSVAGRPFEIFSAVSIIAGWGNPDASGVQIFGMWNERVAGIFEVGGVDRLSGWQSVSPPTQAELGRGTPGCGESALLRVRVGHPPTRQGNALSNCTVVNSENKFSKSPLALSSSADCQDRAAAIMTGHRDSQYPTSRLVVSTVVPSNRPSHLYREAKTRCCCL